MCECREVGHHFSFSTGSPNLPKLGPKILAFPAHFMHPNRQEPLCSSDPKSLLLKSHNWTWKEAKQDPLQTQAKRTESSLPPCTSTSSPWKRRRWRPGDAGGWEAQGSRGSVPSCSSPLFPAPVAQGYPASWLSLATSPRPLPTSYCGIHPLGLSPRPTFQGSQDEEPGETPIHSLDPSQARGPQGGSQARSQLAGPGLEGLMQASLNDTWGS